MTCLLTIVARNLVLDGLPIAPACCLELTVAYCHYRNLHPTCETGSRTWRKEHIVGKDRGTDKGPLLHVSPRLRQEVTWSSLDILSPILHLCSASPRRPLTKSEHFWSKHYPVMAWTFWKPWTVDQSENFCRWPVNDYSYTLWIRKSTACQRCHHIQASDDVVLLDAVQAKYGRCLSFYTAVSSRQSPGTRFPRIFALGRYPRGPT